MFVSQAAQRGLSKFRLVFKPIEARTLQEKLSDANVIAALGDLIRLRAKPALASMGRLMAATIFNPLQITTSGDVQARA
jgi:hypothetical protein